MEGSILNHNGKPETKRPESNSNKAIIKMCSVCGKKFKKRCNSQKYCAECGKIVRKQQNKQSDKKHKIYIMIDYDFETARDRKAAIMVKSILAEAHLEHVGLRRLELVNQSQGK